MIRGAFSSLKGRADTVPAKAGVGAINPRLIKARNKFKLKTNEYRQFSPVTSHGDTVELGCDY